MQKVYGTTGRTDALRKIGQREWCVYYGQGEDEHGAYGWKRVFDHAPSSEEVEVAVCDAINKEVAERILHGMRYRGRMVWLSAENQRNIAFAAALARGGGLGSLPTLKLGTDEDFELYTLADADEVAAFAAQVQAHIERCIAWGREEKAQINYSDYLQEGAL